MNIKYIKNLKSKYMYKQFIIYNLLFIKSILSLIVPFIGGVALAYVARVYWV